MAETYPVFSRFMAKRYWQAVFIVFVIFLIAFLPNHSLARELRDVSGITITVPDKIERIAAAGPPASIFLYSLAPDLMLGWPNRWNPRSIEFLGEPATTMKIVGSIGGKSGAESNLEYLIASKPDIIIDLGNHGKTNLSIAERIRNRTNIPFVLYDGSVDQLPHAYREVGELIGRKDEGEKRAAFIENHLAKIDRIIAAIPYSKRPGIYYARGMNGLESGGTKSIHAETIELGGGRNIIGEVGGNTGILQVSGDRILALDPDIIVASDSRFADMARNDPVWKNLRAVKTGHVLTAPSLPFSFIDLPPSVNRVIGVMWLAHQLYPDRYEGDFKADLKEFYSLFYHVDLDDSKIDAVLGLAKAEQ